MARLLKKPVGEMCTFDAPIDEVQPAVHRAATERLRIKEKLVYRSFYPFDTGDSAFYPVSTETNDPRMARTQRRHFDQESDAGTLIGGYGSGNIYIAEFFAAGPTRVLISMPGTGTGEYTPDQWTPYWFGATNAKQIGKRAASLIGVAMTSTTIKM